MPQTRGEIPLVLARKGPPQKKNNRVPYRMRSLKAITDKQNKGGQAYASGKTLVVFAEGVGEWFPNKLARQLPDLDFEAVWVVGLQGVEAGEYVYNVTRLDQAHAPVWRVRVAPDFNSWNVELIQ